MNHQISFDEALKKTIGQHQITTIGTQKERTLHATLKCYFASSQENIEAKIGPYYADIKEGNHIIEIQTRRLDKLKDKIEYYLSQGFDITIVYPLAKQKTLNWLDPTTGIVVETRKSPRHQGPLDALYELYGLLPYLNNPRVKFSLVLLSIDEYRELSGYGLDKKKRAPRMERIPVLYYGEYELSRKEDYLSILPSSLPKEFTIKEFGKEAKIPKEAYARAAAVLVRVGALVRVGKRRNAYLYRVGEKTL